MRRAAGVASALLLALVGCDDAALGPTATGLLLEVMAPQGVSLAADQVRIHLDGPTPVTRTAQPGETVTLPGLEPGSYDLQVEGLLGGDVEWFDQLAVTITAGQTTTRTVTARSFVPADLSVSPTSADPGQTLSLQWDAVTGATAYRVEVADNPGFAGRTVSDVQGTSLDYPAQPPGTYHFRVRAVNSFDSQSLPSPAVTTIVVAPVLEPGEFCSDHPDFAIATFEDGNLEAAVRQAVSVGGEEDLRCGLLGTLTELSARNADISSVVGLQNLTGLMDLDLSFNPIGNIDPLTGLANLTFLQIRRSVPSDILTTRITDISALEGLTNLKLLDLFSNEISDVGPLSGLTDLEVLDLGFNTIGDISDLGGLGSLTDLRLSRIGVSDITALAGLTSLTKLDLSGNDITEIGALSGLESLTELNLGSITFGGFPPVTDANSITDLGPLSGLTNLTTLDLDLNSISNLSPLDDLTNLTGLDLAGNDITDIVSLSGLTSLTDLDLGPATDGFGVVLGSNSISDISPLTGLTNLTYLDLRSNPLTDIQPLLDNPGVGSGDVVLLDDTDVSCADVAALEARGVTVSSDCAGGVITIAEARETLGAEVTVEGVVTWQPPWENRSFFLQDGTAGIAVFNPDEPEDLVQGERIRLTGTTSTFRGELQISPVASLDRLGVESVPEPIVVAGADVNDGSFQGELVTLEGTVESVEVRAFDNQFVLLRDPHDTEFAVWADTRTGVLPEVWPAPGGMVRVTGVLGTDDLNSVIHRVEVRSPDDVQPFSASEAVRRAARLYECALASYVVGAGLLGDELADGQTWPDFYDFDRRTMEADGLAATLGCASPSGGIVKPLGEAYEAAEFARSLLPNPVDPSDQALLGTALAYSGYSILHMAESFCTPDPGRDLEDAAERFTEAIAWAVASGVADTVRQLALVGRARARLGQGDLAGAQADAAQVPTAFGWEATYDAGTRRNQVHVRITQNRELTVEDDVRVLPDMPVEDTGMPAADGTTPHWNQTKYADAGSPILMGHGREARLIQAEFDVLSGNIANFTELVNQVRVFDGLAPVPMPPTVGSFDEPGSALHLLLRERSRVLFLEGRHLGDWRRWDLEFTPPDGAPFKDGSTYGGARCFPTG